MSQAALSLEQAPPITVPLRFFLTAPLFGMAAALVLAWTGPEALHSRWTPGLLGVTHLLTLGFLALVMCGALLQLMPVFAGAPVRHPQQVSTLVHGLLTPGILLLAAGLVTGHPWPLRLASGLLGAGFAVFIYAVGMSLARSRSRHDSIRGMRLALLSLLVTVGFGLYLLIPHAWRPTLPARTFTDLHLAWGLVGWVSLLSIAVAYQVVPMFQMTRDYPHRLRRGLGWLLFMALLLWSWGRWPTLEAAPWRHALGGLAGVTAVTGLWTFATTTLWLQGRRRRRLPDITLRFWQLGMASLVLAGLLWLVGGWLPATALAGWHPLLLGLLMILGFGMSVTSGMLYKILPFLVWLHLQRQARDRAMRRAIPNVKAIIPAGRARVQFVLHGLSLLLLTMAALQPGPLLYPAALVLLLSSGLLWMNLYNAARCYRGIARQFTARQEAGGQSSVDH